MKNVIILGSTGSIGRQTLEVIEKLREDFNVCALACGKNIELLKKQIKKFHPKFVCISDKKGADEIKKEFCDTEVLSGEENLSMLAESGDYDILVSAANGIISAKAVLAAIKNKKTIALANKETLVAAGDIVMREAKKYNAKILPVDSEHSAILQCLNRFNDNYSKRLWITASGGPFLNNTKEEMKNFTPSDVLKHPNWTMGKKITVDCATLVNKGFEVIEAHHLFNYDYENIKVVIHPESIVHSFVEFVDGSFLAQMGVPSMHIPIQYALCYPIRCNGIKSDSFNPIGNTLHFLEPDIEKFPLLKLTTECGKTGGIMPAVMNAVNEEAVYKFLNNEIKFTDIEKIVYKNVEKYEKFQIQNPTLEDIFEIDKCVRKELIM